MGHFVVEAFRGSRRYRRKMYGKRSFGPPTPAPHRSWLIIPGLTSVVGPGVAKAEILAK